MTKTVRPGEVIGIVGGGQLGRMLAIPARQLGYGVAILAPAGDAPAAGLADVAIRASFEDPEAARALARASAVLTYEFENIPHATVADLERLVPVRPSAELLRITQDRLLEHDLLHRLGVPTAPGEPVRSRIEARAALGRLGLPARLKTARGGYDGGGQWRITAPADLEATPLPEGEGADGRESADGRDRADGAGEGARFLLEGEVRFEREISVILARDLEGRIEFFPVFENTHRAGILIETRCPARVSERTAARAREIGRVLAEAVGLIGTLTVECFVVGDDGGDGGGADGEVLVNELAPRVHNSGHLTLDACDVSQFAQHVRAVCGLPLIAPTLLRPAAMRNLLGAEERRRSFVEGLPGILGDPDVRFHWYGKSSERPRRKMGHLTALGQTAEEAAERAERACRSIRLA